jgi:hypothetical protein
VSARSQRAIARAVEVRNAFELRDSMASKTKEAADDWIVDGFL